LDNSLDFSRVCTTPINPRIRDRLPGDLELELGMY
jgi:hypothetical protein